MIDGECYGGEKMDRYVSCMVGRELVDVSELFSPLLPDFDPEVRVFCFIDLLFSFKTFLFSFFLALPRPSPLPHSSEVWPKDLTNMKMPTNF